MCTRALVLCASSVFLATGMPWGGETECHKGFGVCVTGIKFKEFSRAWINISPSTKTVPGMQKKKVDSSYSQQLQGHQPVKQSFGNLCDLVPIEHPGRKQMTGISRM